MSLGWWRGKVRCHWRVLRPWLWSKHIMFSKWAGWRWRDTLEQLRWGQGGWEGEQGSPSSISSIHYRFDIGIGLQRRVLFGDKKSLLTSYYWKFLKIPISFFPSFNSQESWHLEKASKLTCTTSYRQRKGQNPSPSELASAAIPSIRASELWTWKVGSARGNNF